MSDDLVKRLRELENLAGGLAPTIGEAADRIEALERELAMAHAVLQRIAGADYRGNRSPEEAGLFLAACRLRTKQPSK
jgi:hypothetical protein